MGSCVFTSILLQLLVMYVFFHDFKDFCLHKHRIIPIVDSAKAHASIEMLNLCRV